MKDNNRIYVRETAEAWIFDTVDSPLIVRCIVDKSEDDVQNMDFVDRYLNGENIIKEDYSIESNPVNLKFIQD